MELAARAEGAMFHVADAAERDALLSLARTADAGRRGDRAYRDELRRWTTDDPYRDDGVAVEAVGPWSRGGALPLRDFAADREIPGRRTEAFEREPTLVTLATLADTPMDWLVGGQALQCVWLEATRMGLASSLFAQPLEDPRLREFLRGREGVVQAVFRLGYGPPVPASRRRPAEDVIVQ